MYFHFFKINNGHTIPTIHIIFPWPPTKFLDFPDQINSPNFDTSGNSAHQVTSILDQQFFAQCTDTHIWTHTDNSKTIPSFAALLVHRLMTAGVLYIAAYNYNKTAIRDVYNKQECWISHQRMIHTLSFLTRRLLVFSPSTKLMASIKFDFPVTQQHHIRHLQNESKVKCSAGFKAPQHLQLRVGRRPCNVPWSSGHKNFEANLNEFWTI